MALSLSSRRQAQSSATTTSWSGQQANALQTALQTRSRHLRLQKQHSFTDGNRVDVSVGGGSTSNRNGRPAYMTRGLSVDRSFESFRQRLIAPKCNTSEQQLRRTNSKLKDSALKALRNSTFETKSTLANHAQTTALLKSLSGELKQVNGVLGAKTDSSVDANAVDANNRRTESLSSSVHMTSTLRGNHAKISSTKDDAKSDTNRINLNIVLAQTIKNSVENETTNSDIESCSEAADSFNISSSRPQQPIRVNVAPTASAQQRRTQFRSSRSTTINASTFTSSNIPAQVPAVDFTSAASGNFSASPSLIVQRRAPLVRAMSAPVRSRSLDENSKGAITTNKRKLRRRKLLPRNASVCDNNDRSGSDNPSDLILDLNDSRKKPPLTRTRSTIAVDVITLVSLVSSEGSDSEREDSSTTAADNTAPCSGRPLSLRKTGKSVSFQENYPPNFQLATKEYSHMIRRGSVAPLAARLRANRPPTAPPVSIFMNDSNNVEAMSSTTAEKSSSDEQTDTTKKNSRLNDKENAAADNSSTAEECTFPDYVRSIKERECWKLYRKMSVKGVNVTYDTILRGMLTPTEFRQIQKQRELEEAKAHALAEEKEATENQPPPLTAVERLSQTHLKK